MGDCRIAPGLVQSLPKAGHLLADTAYDSDAFRQLLLNQGTTPVIKPNPTRKHVPVFDQEIYKCRNLIERAFSHLKDWRRVATRYDKLARNYRATVALAAILIWWSN
jgi:putative transposase